MDIERRKIVVLFRELFFCFSFLLSFLMVENRIFMIVVAQGQQTFYSYPHSSSKKDNPFLLYIYIISIAVCVSVFVSSCKTETILLFDFFIFLSYYSTIFSLYQLTRKHVSSYINWNKGPSGTILFATLLL